MQAYSLDLRQRIVAALDAGKRPSEVAAQFSVGVSTVKRYRQQRRDTGRLDPRFSPGRTPTIRQMVRENHVLPSDLIAPLFSCEGQGVEVPISSLPG